jgi:hypothetical protein
LSFGKDAEVTTFEKDRYQRIWPALNAEVSMLMQSRLIAAWPGVPAYAKDQDLYVLEWGESSQTGAMGRFFSYSPLAMAKKQQCVAGLNSRRRRAIAPIRFAPILAGSSKR